MFVIKFAFYFCLSFLILSIPVGEDKVVFSYMDQIAKPMTSKVFSTVKGVFTNGLKETKEVTSKMFNNTSAKQDKILTNLSSVKKSIEAKLPKDNYTKEEKEAILNVLKQESN
ncbi:hypothetical protein [Bacteriovorax sp. Seq25_V]|uniref:hypothetical protein n=1 Tax=Bacteriovorax sp. Seq25_V TaxID=1201288 RepID=UPI00038A48D1|nr:hypothetical protein [Bacteriovorax sp. Seq25_V]EQC43293.1 hypothetical protein M900_0252 [Bacteriovorax sp. Seq25_V]